MKALKNPLFAFISLCLFGVAVEFGLDAYIQLTILFICVNALMAMSLNLVNGYTGQFSLGHAGFMALGAYFSAYASTKWDFLPSNFSLLSAFIFTLGSGLVAAAAGFIVGLPSLRLKGDYLAIVTLGFGEIIRVALLNMDFLGGPRGLANIPSIGSFPMSFGFAAIWLVICFFTIWRVMHSSYGRGFLSVREDEIAAESMGINTTSMKVRAFVLSSFFAGVAGALFAHFTNFINPSSFTFLTSVNAVIMVVLGGMGSMTGSIVAAIFITALPEALRPLQEITGVDLRMVIYSLALILVMIWRPKGIFGELELSDVWRKYVRRSA
ncbi:branched-chain amino acid ABC transporter permease [Bdellovibrio sp. NC01]|uniref:branched-chain amino acid ABC transporter permease n=1 Tax=Bdellovibrio sp. NC01 TaxID=2220073 RepID=UPI001158A73F|nr:branched-chain amino acid ABC transporter permease [Bdellovibrio sp. NC01]